ncbi:MAG: hypothetical protein RSG52_05860 [Terrisporobacter sp.]|uniref:hypothetical protein n=1 Tax=Terrisporobacter sp. TaxID=1965305 RepID=UPI002FC5A6B1
MDRWRKLNVYVSTGGFLCFIIGLLLVKISPLFFCLAAFGLGIAYKGFKNIYKNVEPPEIEKVTDPYDNSSRRKQKKKKKRK